MAKLTIGDKTVTVDDSFLKLAPQDQQKTVDEIAASLGTGAAPVAQAQQTSLPMSAGGYAMDAAKSIGSGLAQGAAGMAQFPAQIGNWLGEKVTGGIDTMMGVSQDEIANRRAQATQTMNSIPTSPSNLPQVQYIPQTLLGDYLQTGGQFAASLPAGGPKGLLARTVAAGTGAIGSETAGQATKGTAAEPYARLIGGLLGGLAPSTIERAVTKNPLKSMREAAPSYAENKANTNAAYADLEARGIHVPHEDLHAINQGVAHDMKGFTTESAPQSMAIAAKIKDAQVQNETELANGIKAAQARQAEAETVARASRATNHPNAAADTQKTLDAAIETLAAIKAAKQGKKVYFHQLDELRKEAGATAAGGEGVTATDQAAAAKIKGHIDAALEKTDGTPEINAAREMARRNILAREAIKIEKKSKWYTSGDESGLRNQFSSFGKREGEYLTPTEKKAAGKVVRREGVHGLLNTTGSKLVQAMLAGAGLSGGTGLLPLAAGVGISMGSRALSGVMTNKAAQNFLKTVLAGKNAQQQAEILMNLRRGKSISGFRQGLLGSANSINASQGMPSLLGPNPQFSNSNR